MSYKQSYKFLPKKHKFLSIDSFKPLEKYIDLGLLEKILTEELKHLATLGEVYTGELVYYDMVKNIWYTGNIISFNISKDKLTYLVAELEIIKANTPAKASYPVGIDKVLFSIFVNNKSFYRKLYTFHGGRYKSILNKNDYLSKDELMDSNTLFYGNTFLSELLKFWKFHSKKPIIFSGGDMKALASTMEFGKT